MRCECQRSVSPPPLSRRAQPLWAWQASSRPWCAARAALGMNAVDELLLHFGRQYRLPENLPPGRHRAGELLEEVLDAAWAAAEVVEHHVAHDAPTQARAPAQRGVDVCGADDAFGNEVINFPRQRGLQAIGYMPGHFLAQPHSLLAQPRIEFR